MPIEATSGAVTRSPLMPLSSASGGAKPVPAANRPRLRRIAAVTNPAWGSVGADAAAELAELLAQHGYEPTLASPQPVQIEAAVRAAIGSAPGQQLILVGDGTARLAAELASPDGPLIAPLPGETLNIPPHALCGPQPWRAALQATLTEGVERSFCGGWVCGRVFLAAAILGTPAIWDDAREAVRAGDLRQTVLRASFAFRRAFTGRIQCALDDRPARAAEALVLTVTKTMNDARALEAAALDLHCAWEVFGLAFNGLVSDRRCDCGVTVEPCVTGWAGAHHIIPAILDDEVQRLPRRATSEFVPEAFRTFVPAAAPVAGP